jgi:hypothetical protein
VAWTEDTRKHCCEVFKIGCTYPQSDSSSSHQKKQSTQHHTQHHK